MTVYIPIPVEIEPPPIYGWVVFITKEHDEISGKVYPDGFRILYSNGLQPISNTDTVTHWLKKVTLPTEDELKHAISLLSGLPSQSEVEYVLQGAKMVINNFNLLTSKTK